MENKTTEITLLKPSEINYLINYKINVYVKNSFYYILFDLI